MVPVIASRHSGLSLITKDAETLGFATVPVREPPLVPSQVKLPESDVPLCAMVIVTIQPVTTGLHPVRTHVPETSTGALGLFGLVGLFDEHPEIARAVTNPIPIH